MTTKTTTLFVAFFLFIGIITTKAQDIHLSQFYSNHQVLNPALTGDFDGKYRVTLNYRSQWSQLSVPITTSILAFEKKINLPTQEVGVGGLIIHDRFSDFSIANTKIYLSGSYRRNLGFAELSGGVQLGYVLKRQDLANQTYPVQWDYDQGDFDINLPDFENGLLDNVNYFDMNFGIVLSKKWNKKVKSKLGYAAFHITAPEESFFKDGFKLKWRSITHLNTEFSLNENIYIEPHAMLMWTTATQNFVIGSNFRYQTGKMGIRTGFFHRGGLPDSDALIYKVGLIYKPFEIGFSYDFNISELSQSTIRKSTYEISFIYTAANISLEQESIPCERF